MRRLSKIPTERIVRCDKCLETFIDDTGIETGMYCPNGCKYVLRVLELDNEYQVLDKEKKK